MIGRYRASPAGPFLWNRQPCWLNWAKRAP